MLLFTLFYVVFMHACISGFAKNLNFFIQTTYD